MWIEVHVYMLAYCHSKQIHNNQTECNQQRGSDSVHAYSSIETRKSKISNRQWAIIIKATKKHNIYSTLHGFVVVFLMCYGFWLCAYVKRTWNPCRKFRTHRRNFLDVDCVCERARMRTVVRWTLNCWSAASFSSIWNIRNSKISMVRTVHMLEYTDVHLLSQYSI